MAIDWTTFALELINFLALVWILKRFLYRPVLEVLERRRAAVARTLEEARQTEVRATELRGQFENRLADWGQERAALRAALEAELAAERERQMQALARDLAAERERQAAQEAHRDAERGRLLETQALAQARTFASTLLARLAGPELEDRLVAAFIEDLGSLPEERLAGLRTAAADPGTQARITTAFPLPEAQRQRLARGLAARLGRTLPLAWCEDARLLAGLRLAIGPWQLGLSLADELAGFDAAAHPGG